MKPIIDPEFQSLLPPLSADECETLEASILAEGCHTPVWVWQGILVDGHNRVEICDRHRIGYTVNYLDKPTRDDVILWMVRHQGGRRNLSDIDRIALVTKKEHILAKQAKERQKASGGDKKSEAAKSAGAKSPQPPPPPRTREAAAKEAGVGGKKYTEGKTVLAAVEAGEAAPEIIEEIRSGKASVHGAAAEIKKKRKAAAVAKAEAAVPKPTQRTGDLKKIEAVLGEAFARAVEIGTLLKTPYEMKAFMALSPEDQKAIDRLIIKGWKVATALKFIHRTIDDDTRIHDLIHRCIQAKGPFVATVGAFTITTVRTGRE